MDTEGVAVNADPRMRKRGRPEEPAPTKPSPDQPDDGSLEAPPSKRVNLGAPSSPQPRKVAFLGGQVTGTGTGAQTEKEQVRTI